MINSAIVPKPIVLFQCKIKKKNKKDRNRWYNGTME